MYLNATSQKSAMHIDANLQVLMNGRSKGNSELFLSQLLALGYFIIIIGP